MPRYLVRQREDLRALVGMRQLASPGGASARLGITRQAIYKSSGRPRGELLVWVFEQPGWWPGKRRESWFVDLGPRGAADARQDPPPDPHQWQQSTPAQLLADAVERWPAEAERRDQAREEAWDELEADGTLDELRQEVVRI